MRSNLIKNKNIFILLAIILIILVSFILFSPSKKNKISCYEICDPIHFANAPITSSNILKDKNDLHLLHAQRSGLKKPFTTNALFNAEIADFVRKSLLVEVVDNRYYQLKSLTHSQPYLIPEAIDMLNDIGYRFQKRLKEKKYKNFKFRLTSLLRTVETQNSLSQRNRNATGHSAHLYGTTVDISYKNFVDAKTDSVESSYEAVQTLTNTLIEMRQQCKLLVVRERKQSCFHITVVLCRPLKN